MSSTTIDPVLYIRMMRALRKIPANNNELRQIKIDVECPKGWRNIVREMDRKIAAVLPEYTLLSIKNKFGNLRVNTDCMYMDEKMSVLTDHIHEAESLSVRCCPDCEQHKPLGTIHCDSCATTMQTESK